MFTISKKEKKTRNLQGIFLFFIFQDLFQDPFEAYFNSSIFALKHKGHQN